MESSEQRHPIQLGGVSWKWWCLRSVKQVWEWAGRRLGGVGNGRGEGRQDPGGHCAVWHALLCSGNYHCKCHMGADMGGRGIEGTGRPGLDPGPFLQVVGSPWKLKRLLFFLGKLSNDLCTLPSLSGDPNYLGEQWFGVNVNLHFPRILIFFLSIYMSSLYIKDSKPLLYLLHIFTPALSFAV